MNISYSRRALLRQLNKNREKYQVEYEKALMDRDEYCQEKLDQALKDFRDKDEFETVYCNQKPKSEIDRYDKVILKLEMCAQDEIELSEDEERHFVHDDWSEQWNVTSLGNVQFRAIMMGIDPSRIQS